MTAPVSLQRYDDGTPTTLESYTSRALLDYLSEAALRRASSSSHLGSVK